MSEQVATRSGVVHSTYWMGPQGHTSFGWDAEDDERIIPMIQKAMDEGYEFWIVRRTQEQGTHEVRLTRVADLQNTRHVIMRDSNTKNLFEEGLIGLLPEEPEQFEQVRRAESAADAAANDTVAHRPARGG